MSGIRRDRLLLILDGIEWHQQQANYEPECPVCLNFRSIGHAPNCSLVRLMRDVERQPKGVNILADTKKKQYMHIVVETEYVLEIEDVDMPRLLDRHREDGKPTLKTAEVVELTDDELQKRLYGS